MAQRISLRVYKSNFADFYFVNIALNHRNYKRTTLRSNLYKIIRKFYMRDVEINIPGTSHEDISKSEMKALKELMDMKDDFKILKKLAKQETYEDFKTELRIWKISKELTSST